MSAVEFINTRPLIAGLVGDSRVALRLAVPSRLVDHLVDESADVALLPVIDLLRVPGLQIIPAGGICSDGETLTVRIFSRRPMDTVARLACDPDSHTSIALARVIFREVYGRSIELIPLTSAGPDDARLLIGDKVICESPSGFPVQLDLGAAWKRLTGLPFVFAVWVGRRGVDVSAIAPILERSRQLGLSQIDEIVKDYAIPRGWPEEIARKYLTEYLHYTIGPLELRAIEQFHALANRD